LASQAVVCLLALLLAAARYWRWPGDFRGPAAPPRAALRQRRRRC